MLAHAKARGVEEAGAVLQRLRLALAEGADVQRGRLQEAAHGQKVVVALGLVDAAGRHARERGRAAQAVAGPVAQAVRRRREHLQPVHHVVHHVEDQVVARPRIVVERGGVVGLEQQREFARAGHVVVEARGQQRAGGVGAAGHGPVFARLDQQPLARDAGVGVVGHVDLGERAVGRAQPGLAVVEVDLARDEVALEAGRVVAPGAHRHVFVRAFVHGDGLGQRRAALPLLHQAWVARAGHGAGAEIGAHVQVVDVFPGDVVLRLRQREAAFDERHAHQVELAHHVGVGAAARQRDQAAFVRGLQAVGAVPNPVLAVLRGQRVEVEHGLPRGLGRAVLVERGAAPQALGVRLVAPEVVVQRTDLADHRNARVRVEHLEQALLDRLEGRRLRIGVNGMCILLASPVQSGFAVDVFEPEMGVFVVRRGHAAQCTKPP
ncbi:hypothetical protein BKP43_50060 [Variovorax boronicumulans]|nr:hypothetical protein BKP43_50060 [Variovorax boronicumulans]